MSLTAKKVNYIFRPLNSNIIVDKLFSCVVNSWRKESQAEENKYLIWTADWGGEHNTPRHTESIVNLFSYKKVTLFLHKNTHHTIPWRKSYFIYEYTFFVLQCHFFFYFIEVEGVLILLNDIRNSKRRNSIRYGLWRSFQIRKKWKLKEVISL